MLSELFLFLNVLLLNEEHNDEEKHGEVDGVYNSILERNDSGVRFLSGRESMFQTWFNSKTSFFKDYIYKNFETLEDLLNYYALLKRQENIIYKRYYKKIKKVKNNLKIKFLGKFKGVEKSQLKDDYIEYLINEYNQNDEDFQYLSLLEIQLEEMDCIGAIIHDWAWSDDFEKWCSAYTKIRKSM